jgi:hypothetical protein
MTLTIDVPPALEAKLESIAAQRGVDVPQLVVGTLEKLESPKPSGRRDGENTGEYIIRLADEVRASMSDADWMARPSDYAHNYKHYLYGAKNDR